MKCFWRSKGAKSITIASVLCVETGGEHMPTPFLHSKFIASGVSCLVLECTTMCRQSRRLVD